MIDAKALFDEVRQIKGKPLDQSEVDRINAIIAPLQIIAKRPPTIAEFIGGFIDAHEGTLSMRADDNGNYQGGKKGDGLLIGSKFGVTGPALAQYRGVGKYTVSARDIATLTRDEAVAIGVKLYYKAPGFDRLPWNRVTASIVDFGWGAGPRQAIKLWQREVRVTDDGVIGPQSIAAGGAWLKEYGEAGCAIRWADRRIAFYQSLGQPQFVKGWTNRTRSFLPGGDWWKEWES